MKIGCDDGCDNVLMIMGYSFLLISELQTSEERVLFITNISAVIYY